MSTKLADPPISSPSLNLAASMNTAVVEDSAIQDSAVEDSTLYVGVKLSFDRIVLIPSRQIVEIISLSPTDITPIPQVPIPIMGIYSWRGEILWIIDGASLFGEIPLCDRNFWGSRYNIFIVQEGGEHVGIMVPDIGNLGKRSRFCTPDPDRDSTHSSTNPALVCPPIVDLIEQITQLRHQLRTP